VIIKMRAAPAHVHNTGPLISESGSGRLESCGCSHFTKRPGGGGHELINGFFLARSPF